jgi:hypothetical protein
MVALETQAHPVATFGATTVPSLQTGFLLGRRVLTGRMGVRRGVMSLRLDGIPLTEPAFAGS